MINDTGDTQFHVVMGTPYFTPLPLFPQPFLVGMSRQRHCLFVAADWFHANVQIGSPWQAVAQKALALQMVLTHRSILGRRPEPPHNLDAPGELDPRRPFRRVAQWLAPLSSVEALRGRFLHPIQIANALGYPAVGPFVEAVWRLPPGSLLIVATSAAYPAAKHLEGIYDPTRLQEHGPGAGISYTLRLPSSHFQALTNDDKDAKPWVHISATRITFSGSSGGTTHNFTGYPFALQGKATVRRGVCVRVIGPEGQFRDELRLTSGSTVPFTEEQKSPQGELRPVEQRFAWAQNCWVDAPPQERVAPPPREDAAPDRSDNAGVEPAHPAGPQMPVLPQVQAVSYQGLAAAFDALYALSGLRGACGA